MKKKQRRSWDVRLLSVGFVILLAWLGLGYRLFQVQAVHAAEYAADGADQRVRNEALPAARGTIFDRDGVELAVTISATTVVANPSQIEDPELTARLLAPLVGVSEATLFGRLSRDGQFAYVARRLDRATADRVVALVDELGMSGISYIDEPHRIYPGGALASQLLGFVRADDQVGLEGVERSFDAELSGVAGTQVVERDRFGTPIPQGQLLIEPAVPGSDLVLTIDRQVQFAVEKALAETIAETNAAAGTVVVLDVDSGEILAMANAPTFDPNSFADAAPDAFRNRAVADVYEPGSTLKVVTVAAALEESIVAPSTPFNLPPELLIHDKVYTDVERKEPRTMTVAEIVANSSNIGTIKVQSLLGNELHHEYLARFGMGEPLDLGLPAVAPGLLHPLSDWCETTCGPSTSIGYRVDVTPVQMAAVFAAIANDGVWVEPQLVKQVIDGAGTIDEPQHVERPVISQATARVMREMLKGVVVDGTGYRAAVDEYGVGGKTGTTEKLIPGVGYSPTERIASFIGIAPIDRPEVVIAVVLDSPHGEVALPNGGTTRLEFGGVSAAPLFAEIAAVTLHQLGVPPDGS